REYLSKQIGDTDAENELLECVDKYIVDKTTDKVTEKHKEDVVTNKKDGSSLLTKLFGFGTDKNRKTDKELENKNEFEEKKKPGKIKNFFDKLEKEEEPEAKTRNAPTISKDDRQADILTATDNMCDKQVKNCYETNQFPILDKHIEDIISDDKEPDQSEKAATFVTTQISVTPETCKEWS
ncbi:3003_t:CDS:1, partial [Dentiscutata heterogama]